MSELEEKEILSNKMIVFWLTVIIGIGLVIRFFYFPSGIPIATDGYLSFVYVIRTVFDGGMPEGLTVVNSGWSNFLSFIFIFFEKTDPLQLMDIQRTTSIIISAVTGIPIFFILKRFVDMKWALFGSFLLVIEPRLVILSLEGINYTLFFFLFSLSIVLFLKKTNISLVLCFICLAFTVIVRYEALLMIIPFTIMYFVKFKQKKYIVRFLIITSVMMIILFSVGEMRTQATSDICYDNIIFNEKCGKDGFTSEILGNVSFVQKYIISGEKLDIEEGDESYNIHQEVYDKPDSVWFIDIFSLSFSSLFKFLGLVLIPYFVFFVVFNVITRIKNRETMRWNFDSITIIFLSSIMLLPGIYAYLRGIEEIRYILILIPLICIISVSFRESIRKKVFQDKRILIILLAFCLIISIIFIETQKKDYNYQLETFEISKEIVSQTNIINTFHNSGFIKTAILFKDWPDLPEVVPNTGKIKSEFLKIKTTEYNNLEEYIDENREKGLEYIIVDKNEKLFSDLRENSEDYRYLKKTFDSKKLDFKNEFSMYKINYDLFDLRT